MVVKILEVDLKLQCLFMVNAVFTESTVVTIILGSGLKKEYFQ